MEQTQQQPQERKTRYVVGEKLYGIKFEFGNDKNDIGFRMPYVFDMAPVTKIHIIELTVKEHHRVRNEWAPKDAEPDCDGFILEDKDGGIWHNQYPTASYGQISDEGNRRFHRTLKEGETYCQLWDNKVVTECHLLTDVFSRINRGIKDLSDSKHQAAAMSNGMMDEVTKRLEVLPQCLEAIREQLKSEFNKELIEVPVWKEHPEITTFEVRDMSTSAVLSQKHLQVAEEYQKLLTPELHEHLQAVLKDCPELMTEDAALARLIHFARKAIELRMAQIYPDFDRHTIMAEAAFYLDVMQKLGNECLKPTNQAKFGYIVTDLYRFDKAEEDVLHMNMQLLDVFGYQVNQLVWSQTTDIITFKFKPEDTVSFNGNLRQEVVRDLNQK